MKEFCENLVYYRQLAGLSQERVAHMLGIRVQIVSHWENGKHEPGIHMTVNLARLYGVTVNDLVGMQ